MIKEKLRGKTAGFYLLDGSFPRISASTPPPPPSPPQSFSWKRIKSYFKFDDDIKSVKAAIV